MPVAALLAWLVAVRAGPALAADGAAWVAALGRASETTLHFRSHYLQRDKTVAPDALAWAGGGWLAYRSGWVGDTLRLGVTAHASQKLLGPADKDGAALLLAGQKSYAVPGESFVALKHFGQTLTAGRFLVNQYEVNPQDTRMTPRTFQGAALAGRVGGIDYFVGRLDRMKHRNWDTFEKVATVAGAPAGVSEPLWLVGARGTVGESLNWGLAGYRVAHVLASTYADAAWTTPLGTGSKLRLGGQYMRQGSTGDRLLTGAAFDTAILGFKADWSHGPLTLSGIAMQTDRGAAYRMPFGSWAGYASRIVNNFNRAGERVRGIDAVVDFAGLGAPGLLLAATATVGDRAIDAANGAALSRNAEYDVTADYRFSSAAWPQSMRPLWLRARVGRFEQKAGGARDVTTEYHLVLNYAATFK